MVVKVVTIVTGLALGSFLNCLISRLKINQKGRNYLVSRKRRSYCHSCQKQLPWYDLIPVVSFLILKGRCRFCQEAIPIYHPLVELAVALLALAGYLKFGLSVTMVGYLLIGLVMLGILVYDWWKQLIPDLLIWLGLGLATAFQIYRFTVSSTSLLPLFWGVVAGGGIFYLLYVFSKGRWIGFGDVKLGSVLGLVFGWPLILVNLWLAFVIGGLVGAFLLLRGRKKMTSQIALGPFLAIGFFITVFFGNQLLEIARIYLNLQ